MSNDKQLSPQQRANLFATMTRQYMQMLPTYKASGPAQTISFPLPKARLLSNVMLSVKAKVKITGASNVEAYDCFAPYRILRRVSLNMNNGFTPFIVSGAELAMYNCMKFNPEMVEMGGDLCKRTSASGSPASDEFGASPAGIVTDLEFYINLPTTLNNREPNGLILLANESTTVDVTIDVANGGEIIGNRPGYTVEIQSVDVSPCLETFSVPHAKEAFPDLSVIKLVDSRTEKTQSGTQNIIKLPVGNIYRKMIMYFYGDHENLAAPHRSFNGNFELLFNQADQPYNIDPDHLKYLNTQMYGQQLPTGVFAFDFSSMQGLPNMGGTRDFIDTERLTEFWLRFNPKYSGYVTIVFEKLARLR